MRINDTFASQQTDEQGRSVHYTMYTRQDKTKPNHTIIEYIHSFLRMKLKMNGGGMTETTYDFCSPELTHLLMLPLVLMTASVLF